MAVRVTVAEVKEIIDTSKSDTIISACILGADTLVNSVLGTGSADILKEIERWLAAHLIAISWERQALKEEAGTAKITYTGVYGAGLSSTSYGQMVKTLDATGTMAALDKRPIQIYAIKSFE